MNKACRVLNVSVVLLSLASVVPAQQNEVSGPVAPKVSQAVAHALPISAGDLLAVTVFDTPELSGSLRVNEKGVIAVPIAGDLSVKGMTADQASRAIEGLFRDKDILKKPAVTVFIAEYATQGVTVNGEVRNPGIYPLLGSHGLLELITAAGGATQNAGREVTVAHKDDPSHPEVVEMDNRPGANPVINMDIRPGDTITVSQSGVVYVVGEVNKPGGFMIGNKEPMTVLQAMALANGMSRQAAQNNVKLIRKSGGGREEYSVPLKQIVENKAPDMPLADGDILYIPASGLKILRGRTVDTAVALTSGLAIAGRL